MRLDKTIYNYRWWVTLPLILPVMAIVCMPALIIFLLELLISVVEFVNVGKKPNKLFKKLVNWVQYK
tara:strand:- start:550 stop:750 length:201 start_codon:yes stop_codon:yes gene_type:complete